MEAWPIKDAIDELEGSIRASASSLEGDRCSQEWLALQAIAERKGVLETYGPSYWSTGIGGREHQCVFVPSLEVWYKTTHPKQAGHFFDFEDQRLFPASPIQDLRRLQLSNQFLLPKIEMVSVLVGPTPGKG